MPSIGIFGGSGFYELLDDATEHRVDTPYGEPSDPVVTGSWQGREVAFLPRHGADHRFPPHRVNYRANVWAMRELGVTRLLAPCAVGSLKAELGPGAMIVLDQFVDRTTGRPDTFHDGPPVTHTSMAEPYCGTLRALVTEELTALDRPHQPTGTIVVIQGPRFSTRAESRWFSAQGWDVVGMTQYPEVPLAREAGMCVAGIALVTDHDAGLDGHPDVAPVSHQQVLEVFAANVEHLKELLGRVVARIPDERDCGCGSSTG
ncbi:MAG: S-methyl-5'-thioadenosine phosphorylase [Actinobacteria bacterium]|nr:S-methyl-5'-thioadenosine phosphorylase [Actinomycetota bacterium]